MVLWRCGALHHGEGSFFRKSKAGVDQRRPRNRLLQSATGRGNFLSRARLPGKEYLGPLRGIARTDGFAPGICAHMISPKMTGEVPCLAGLVCLSSQGSGARPRVDNRQSVTFVAGPTPTVDANMFPLFASARSPAWPVCSASNITVSERPASVR